MNRNGYTYNANLANVNLQTSPGPGVTTPNAWLINQALFTTGTKANWISPFITPYIATNTIPTPNVPYLYT